LQRVIDVDLTGMGRNLDKRRFDPSATVPGFGVTIHEMRRALQELYTRVGGPRRRAGLLTDPVRPWRGVRYWVCAVVAAVIGVYVAWMTRGDFDGAPGWVIAAAAAVYLALRGAVCFRPRAETVLALDGRAPVIYLRSFSDDDALVERPIRLTLEAFRRSGMPTEFRRDGARVMLNHGKVRLEQAIEDEVSALGPFIAIGEPHEGHPDFGATRAYFEGDDEAWRRAVQAWIERAVLLVVVPAQTRGLGWELERIQAGGSTAKLLLIFPPEPPEYRAARMAALAGMLTDPRWAAAIAAPTTGDLLAVFSTGRGEPVRVHSTRPRLAELEFAVELALYGMFCLSTARALPGRPPALPLSR
jgi:hypothetical protein